MAKQNEVELPKIEAETLSIPKRGLLEIWYEFYQNNVPLEEDKIQALINHGYIVPENIPERKRQVYRRKIDPQKHFEVDRDDTISNKEEQIVASLTDITTSDSDDVSFSTNVFKIDEYETDSTSTIKKGKKEIVKDDWCPSSRLEHTQQFVLWIDSINNSFASKRYYEKYDLYCQQADMWYASNDSIINYETGEEQWEFAKREFDRCNENTLYFANKYCYLYEPDMEGGKRKYYANENYEHHRVLLYLFDCGYSFMLGKPRQIGSTSALGLAAIKKTLFTTNHYLKYIAEDKKTSEEIFDQKIKFCYATLPEWMKDSVVNDRDNLFRIGKKGKKGDISGTNSKIEVVVPHPTAINGGSPPVVFIDEIGNIGCLSEMLLEARPTLYWRNPETKKFELRRQICSWSTGGYMQNGKGAFEREWNRITGLWKEGNYETGIIPIFFDWTTRCSAEEYEREKAFYYGARAKDKNMDLEQSKIQFHQHYPSSPADMFSTTTKTLVSRESIDAGLKRIAELPALNRGVWGYFEPVYDTSKPLGEDSDIPFKIIGADFIPCEDEMDEKCTTFIFSHPKRNWRNRYYQGTDPISSDTGTSKFASAIWDAQYYAPVALVNYRESHNTKKSYLQSILLGMYYDVERGTGVKDLLERNAGMAYKDYKDAKGFFHTLVFASELPDVMQSGGGDAIGIDNNNRINQLIIDRMTEVCNVYGDRIYIPTFWEQLKTFICKLTDSGRITWTSIDKRYFCDDVLFAVTFSYICRLCYSNKIPYDINDENIAKGKETTFDYVYDNEGNLDLVEVPRKKN